MPGEKRRFNLLFSFRDIIQIYFYILIIMTETIEYVIYVRKSTDDTSWERQAQSIPDQIERCVTYAKEHGLVLRMKPDNFEFEDEKELRLEDN